MTNKAKPNLHGNQLGGVILVGGQSSRMGRDKSQLQLGGNTFLNQIFLRISSVVGPVVIVGSKFQRLEKTIEPLERVRPHVDITVAHDQHEGCGPLEGIRVGLKSLEFKCSHGFVISCDAPLVKPELIQYLFARIENCSAVIPCDGSEKIYGTTAVYETRLHPRIGELIVQGERRVASLATHFDSRLIEIEALREIDERLDSFRNINELKDYHDLLRQTGSPRTKH